MISPSRLPTLLMAALVLVSGAVAGSTAASARAIDGPLDWPEEQQRFWFDGPAWLLPEVVRDRLAALPARERGEAMEAFLARDPIPETRRSELVEAIAARRALVLDLSLSTFDERSRLLFLNGQPDERFLLDCAEAFKPLEIWRYGDRELILYRPDEAPAYRLWLPFESKRALYTRELFFWLEEWELYKGRIRGRRADRFLCPESKRVDRITGTGGLSELAGEGGVDAAVHMGYLRAPADLVAWAREALASPAPAARPAALAVESVQVLFPERHGPMMETAILATLPPGAALEPFRDEEREELRIRVEGVVETADSTLDSFRIRFVFEPPAADVPVPLTLTRRLRVGAAYRLRLRVVDEIGGAEAVVSHSLRVPEEPRRGDREALELALQSPDRRLDEQLDRGPDGLVLLVPPREVVFGGLRAHAAVKGERIREVAFLVDGQRQISRTTAPWMVELALPRIPRPLAIRAEGYDAGGVLVAADEVFLNQPRGRLDVEIVRPERGAAPRAAFTAEALVTVPESRRVEWVEFRLDEELVTRLERPPWQAEIPAPSTTELSFLTVSAGLDDGSRAEDVRFLNTPHEMGEVDVQLVELYTTVLGRGGGLIRDLQKDAFEVYEDGTRQEVVRFQVVDDLPLTVGITLDVSGSMFSSLGEAQRAAVDFLAGILTPRDQTFAVVFSSEPALAIPRTEDVGAIQEALEGYRADGYTALHDAVVFSLYYFGGTQGRRVLVLLSDGDDTDSRLEFDEALEYARQSPVVVYTIGLENESLDGNAKRKLRRLAEETGGRSFVISRAEELRRVYEQIGEELRSQYLLAYFSAQSGTGYRGVEVKMTRRGLDARTIRGYYP